MTNSVAKRVIDDGEPVVGPGMEQFRCIGRFALDTQQNIECSGTGRRNCGLQVLEL